MKKILITGKSSYVGTSLANLLENYPNNYSVDFISLKDNLWREKDFSFYDVVYHAAGIAHIKETETNSSLYYKVNRELTYQVAQKAKIEGVKQFIFLSSMSVYGLESGVISKDTPLKPKSAYGKSKLQAEQLIKLLKDEYFKVAILRPPMIYGKGCKGNYTKLSSLAVKTPIFPDIDNKRSMIYITNLSEFVRVLIDSYESGVFFPQNKEYVKTSKMVELIAKTNGKKIWITNLVSPLIDLMKNNNTINKVFGSLVYEKTLSEYSDVRFNSFIDFEESIRLTED